MEHIEVESVTLKRICRLCRTSERGKKPEFQEIFNDFSISEDLFFVTGISIVTTTKTSYPAIICIPCLKKLRELVQFKTEVMKSEEFFRSQDFEIERELWESEKSTLLDSCVEVTNDEDMLNVSIKEEPEFIENDDDESNAIKFIDENDDSDEESDQNESKIKQTKTRTKKKKMASCYCKQCDRYLSSCRALRMHMSVFHDRDNRVFICKHCDQLFRCEEYLVKHVRRNHEKTYNPYEDVTIKTIKSARKPSASSIGVINMLAKPPSRTCRICHKTYSTIRSLRTHMKDVHNNVQRTYICKKCGKRFKLKEFISKHMRKYHDKMLEEGDFSTTDDDDDDDDNDDNEEESEHEEIDECDLVKSTKFKSKNSFCAECNQSFSRSRVYREHMKIKHAIDNYEYICKVCSMSFIVASYLKKHARKYHHISLQPEDIIVREKTEIGEKSVKSKKETVKSEKNNLDDNSDDLLDAMMEFV